jgi:hypothetical protein
MVIRYSGIRKNPPLCPITDNGAVLRRRKPYGATADSDLFQFSIQADEDFLTRSREGREKKGFEFNSPSCLRVFA